jgi:hypothetical protein
MIGGGRWWRILNTEDGRGPWPATEDHLNHKAAQVVGEFGWVEVEQQTDGNTTHLQLCQQLSFMDWQEGRDGFYFENDLTCYDDIRPETRVHGQALVKDRNSDLALEWNIGLPQFVTEAFLVHRFEQASPGATMHDCQPNDTFRQLRSDQHGKNSVAHRGPRSFSVLKPDKM